MWLAALLLQGVLGAPQGGGDTTQRTRCSSHDWAGFYCVPIFQCDGEGVIKVDAVGLFDPRSTADDCDPNADYDNDDCCPPERTQALQSTCSGTLDVCCLHPNSTEQYSRDNLVNYGCGVKGGPGEQSFQPEPPLECSESDCRLFGEHCCPGLEPEPDECSDDDVLFGFCPTETEPDRPEPACGRRNPRGAAAVPVAPAADEAEFGEWPHVCAVLKKEVIGSGAPLNIYQCGASLLDDNVLITAAHCLNELTAADLLVRCGEWDTQTEDEEKPFQEVDVESVKIHPYFNNDNHHNNFAILFTKSSFRRDDHISPICLPQPCSNYNQKNCVANGWGKDKFGSDGRYSTVLKEVVFPVVPHHECQNSLRKTRLGEYFELDKSFICAGGIKGVDTCKGDGGSPLTCRIHNSDRWVQAGIVSWGIGCGEEGVPAVYASVATVSCWVDHEVNKYFGTETRFGFLQSVDCNGALPARDCNEKQFAEIKEEEPEYIYEYDIEDKENNREQVLKDIFSPDDDSERISTEDF